MKRMFVIIVLGIIGSTVFGQSSLHVAENKTYSLSPVFVKNSILANYELETPPGLKQRNTGRTLTILGGALFVGGVVVFSSADEKYYTSTTTNYGTTEEGDPKAAVGILMMAGGAGMAIPGIIFWTKGSKKYKRHLAREEATTSIQFKGNGLSINYRF